MQLNVTINGGNKFQLFPVLTNKGIILIAKAEVKRQGKKTSFVTIELMCENKLVAYATGTYAIIQENKSE